MKTENLILTIVIILVALFLISGLSGYGMMGYGGMMGFGNFGFMWIFASIIWILIIIALILGILWLARQLQNGGKKRMGTILRFVIRMILIFGLIILAFTLAAAFL